MSLNRLGIRRIPDEPKRPPIDAEPTVKQAKPKRSRSKPLRPAPACPPWLRLEEYEALIAMREELR